MLGVLCQKLLLKGIDTGLVSLLVQACPLLHGCERSPALGVDDIGILECLVHAVALLEASARSLGVLLGDVYDIRHDLVALGMSKGYIHTESGEQSDDALRDAQRLSV